LEKEKFIETEEMFSFPPINNIKDLKQKISHLSLRSPLDLVTTDWHLQQPMREEETGIQNIF